MTDAHALDMITNLLRGTSWGPDTIEDIAAIVRQTGRTISDLDDHQCPDSKGACAGGRDDILATTENDSA